MNLDPITARKVVKSRAVRLCLAQRTIEMVNDTGLKSKMLKIVPIPGLDLEREEQVKVCFQELVLDQAKKAKIQELISKLRPIKLEYDAIDGMFRIKESN